MKKELCILHTDSLRELVERVNSEGIQREDVLKLYEQGGTFFLLYYK